MTGDLSLAAEKVVQLMHLLFDSQKQHREIGGTHASILSDGENILCAAEDIGRHNTIDKLAGMCLIQGIDPKKYILITTGRISSDMVQKAVRMGVPILISRTSPTSLSIDFAEYWGLTLVGYARGNRFTIYTHPERISA
jgi:FdhD protein